MKKSLTFLRSSELWCHFYDDYKYISRRIKMLRASVKNVIRYVQAIFY